MHIDPSSGEPMRVAVKLMRIQSQFRRELAARDREFNRELVMDVLQTCPKLDELQSQVCTYTRSIKVPCFVHNRTPSASDLHTHLHTLTTHPNNPPTRPTLSSLSELAGRSKR